MASLRSAAKQLNPSPKRSKAKKGHADYDNPRENIDPHVKTKVVSTREGSIQQTPTTDYHILNKKYCDKWKLLHKTIRAIGGTHYDVQDDDVYILYNASVGNVIVNLPDAATAVYRKLGIKRLNAGANTVTITAAGADTIDGAATVVLNAQYEYREIIAHNGVWHIVATI